LASAFDAIFESLSGTVQQQFDGPFAAMQLPSDLDQFLFALVMEFDPLPGTRAETVHAARQVDQPVIVVGPQGIGGEDRFQFEAQLRPTRFLPPDQTFDVLTQQIASDPQQPRADECRRIEPSLRDVEPQEDFLSHVVGITVLEKPRPQVAVDRPLMLLDHRRKRRTVASPKLLNQRLIDGGLHEEGPRGAVGKWAVRLLGVSPLWISERGGVSPPVLPRGLTPKNPEADAAPLGMRTVGSSSRWLFKCLTKVNAVRWYGPLQTERNRVANACASRGRGGPFSERPLTSGPLAFVSP